MGGAVQMFAIFWTLKRDYDAKVIKLTENYRSTKTILAAANNVVKKQSEQNGQGAMDTTVREGEKVFIAGAPDDLMEALGIAREIDRLVQEGGKNIVILPFYIG